MGALAARCLALALGCGGAAGLLPLDAYHQLLDAHPLATQSLTNGAIWAASDVIAQARARRPLDPARTARFALTGLGSGVLWSGWFRAIDPAVNALAAAPGARVALSIAGEELLFAPLVTGLYVIPASLAQNRGLGALRHLPAEVRATLGPLLIQNARVWTLPNLLIYRAPLEYRVLASNVVDLVWGVVCAEAAAQCGSSADAAEEACVIVDDTAPARGAELPRAWRGGLSPRLRRAVAPAAVRVPPRAGAASGDRT